MNQEESLRNSTCEDQINMAKRELSAFIRTVTELFGPEQARLSAEDWLDQLELMDRPPRATSRDWRAVTVKAWARLVNRGTLARNHRTLAASTDTNVSPIPSTYCLASCNRLPNGGHFAAWEHTKLFSEQIRAAFRSLR